MSSVAATATEGEPASPQSNSAAGSETGADHNGSQDGSGDPATPENGEPAHDDGNQPEFLEDPLEELLRPPSPNPPSVADPIAPSPVLANDEGRSFLGSIASALYNLIPGTGTPPPPPPPLTDLDLPPPVVPCDQPPRDGASPALESKEKKPSSPIMVYLRKRGIPTAEEVTFDLNDYPSNTELAVALFPVLKRFLPKELVGVTSPSQITLVRLSGAYTNCVFMVRCPPFPADEAPEESGGWSLFPRFNWQGRPASRKLILRIYGVGVDRFVQRERELVWMNRLSRMGVGPKLVGCFGNGRLEEFVDSDTLTSPQVKEEAISMQVAAEMARFHLIGSSAPPGAERRGSGGSLGYASPEMRATRTGTTGTLKSPRLDAVRSPRLEPVRSPSLGPQGRPDDGCEMWDRLEKWLKLAEQARGELEARSEREKAKLATVGPWAFWAKQIEWVRDEVAKLKCLVVFSHNDMQYGNILRRKTDGSLIVVDYEYAGFNYRGYDIANHFCEWMFNYHIARPHTMRPEWFPTFEQRKIYYRAYLHAYHSLTGTSFDMDSELGRLEIEVSLLELLVHIHWGLWGIIQAGSADEYFPDTARDDEYDNLGYGVIRLGVFREKKEKVQKMLDQWYSEHKE